MFRRCGFSGMGGADCWRLDIAGHYSAVSQYFWSRLTGLAFRLSYEMMLLSKTHKSTKHKVETQELGRYLPKKRRGVGIKWDI